MAARSSKARWEDALNQFLGSWRDRSDVIGALATGSRVLGTDTRNSDVDVHIVLSERAKWRERGNCVIDGYLIEYFCNPVVQLRKYRKDNFKDFTRIDARMFGLGMIIFDKRGVLKRLQTQARKELASKFRKLSVAEIELGKYGIWDDLDNLKDLRESNSRFYDYSHHLLLHRVLDLYRRFVGIEVTSSSKLDRYFTDASFRERYGIGEFSDKKFVQLFLRAVETPSFKSADRLVKHVLQNMGGFDIASWKFRSKISV